MVVANSKKLLLNDVKRRMLLSAVCIVFILIQFSCSPKYVHYNFGRPEYSYIQGIQEPAINDSLVSQIKLVATLPTESIKKRDLESLKSRVEYLDGKIVVYDDSIVVVKNYEPAQLDSFEIKGPNFEREVKAKKYLSTKKINQKAILLLLFGLLTITLILHSISEAGGRANQAGRAGIRKWSEENKCYIATVCYGSYDSKEVLILRKFRDEVLSRFLLGRHFIRVYYKHSPNIADKLRGKASLNGLIRTVCLDPLVFIIGRLRR